MSEKPQFKLLVKLYNNLFNIEIVSLLLFCIAIFLKNQNISGGSVLLIISISFLANAYFYCSLYKNEKLKDAATLFGNKIGFYGLAALMISILFKLQHWPNPGQMMYIGGFASVIAIGINIWKGQNNNTNRIIIILIISLLIQYFI